MSASRANDGEAAFKILVAIPDDRLLPELVRRIRKDLSTIPLELDVEVSPRKLLAAFREKHHELLILSSSLTGMPAVTLVSEIRRVSGSSFVLFIGDPMGPGACQGIGVEWINPPIVNWTRFLDKVRSSVPEVLRGKLRISQSDVELYQALMMYGLQYSETGGGAAETPRVALIPKHFFQLAEAAEGLTTEAAVSPAASPSGVPGDSGGAVPEIPWEQRKRVLRIEGTMLGLLLAATAAFTYFGSADASERWLSFRNVLALVTAFAFLGFFAGRPLDRYLAAKRPEQGD